METIIAKFGEERLSACVATVGMFDGVHRGHQLVIGKVVGKAHEMGLASTVITFDKAPRQVLDPSFHPQLLTTLEEKTALIGTLGVDRLVILPFTKALAGLTAQQFMTDILYRQLGLRHLIIGYDNRFGHNRAEGFEDYVRYGQQLGMTVERGDVLMAENNSLTSKEQPISSSVIRRLLTEDGRVDLMPQYMTRHYELQGTVRSGEHIGHQIGYPTANLEPTDPDKLIPAPGVYAVWATIEGEQQARAAMMNIGNRPTFQGSRQTQEVNIFDFDGDLYGKSVRVSFVERLREERRFESAELLVRQLHEDQAAALQILMNHK